MELYSVCIFRLVGGLEDIFLKFKNMLADILWIIVIRVLNLSQLGPGNYK